MKKEFSNAWKSSTQVRKQRKYVANAPLHIKRKMISSSLSKDLRTKYKRRSFPVRKDDEVKIMVGKFKGKTGKISGVDVAKQRVTVEGIQRKKKDGTNINIYFNASNLQIQKLNLDDRKRVKSVSRTGGKVDVASAPKVEKKLEVKKDEKPKTAPKGVPPKEEKK